MITIRKSPKADSRSTNMPPTVDELRNDTISHITDVTNALTFLSTLIKDRGHQHDNTKMSNMEEFHDALNSGHIKDTPWYKKHITEERHHLKSYVPKDVTLIDVIEHLADCTMAGLARSGTVYDVDLSPELLQLAVQNTVEMLKRNTKVITNELLPNNDILDEKSE